MTEILKSPQRWKLQDSFSTHYFVSIGFGKKNSLVYEHWNQLLSPLSKDCIKYHDRTEYVVRILFNDLLYNVHIVLLQNDRHQTYYCLLEEQKTTHQARRGNLLWFGDDIEPSAFEITKVSFSSKRGRYWKWREIGREELENRQLLRDNGELIDLHDEEDETKETQNRDSEYDFLRVGNSQFAVRRMLEHILLQKVKEEQKGFYEEYVTTLQHERQTINGAAIKHGSVAVLFGLILAPVWLFLASLVWLTGPFVSMTRDCTFTTRCCLNLFIHYIFFIWKNIIFLAFLAIPGMMYCIYLYGIKGTLVLLYDKWCTGLSEFDINNSKAKGWDLIIFYFPTSQ
eukprot:TRINITY_DN3728_c0_g1_i4.p1 TRINITY_DN3728_c0_g1~~TRINITY_DN3728_c0_g1_i4.p1  ORF type:complete len:341 (+),score=32.57 TRINITY_DN3728_c0_g1_i4:77-1099(+)